MPTEDECRTLAVLLFGTGGLTAAADLWDIVKLVYPSGYLVRFEIDRCNRKAMGK